MDQIIEWIKNNTPNAYKNGYRKYKIDNIEIIEEYEL